MKDGSCSSGNECSVCILSGNLGSHQHSAFSSIAMIAMIAMIGSMLLRGCVGDMVVVVVILPSVLATMIYERSSVLAMMATLVLVYQQEMTVVAAIGSWAGDRFWKQLAVMTFLGTKGDCCMIIAVAEGVVELSAQVLTADVVVLAIIYSYVLVASSSSHSCICM